MARPKVMSLLNGYPTATMLWQRLQRTWRCVVTLGTQSSGCGMLMVGQVCRSSRSQGLVVLRGRHPRRMDDTYGSRSGPTSGNTTRFFRSISLLCTTVRQVNNTHEVHAMGLRFDRRYHRMESGLCMALDTKNTQVSVCGN